MIPGDVKLPETLEIAEVHCVLKIYGGLHSSLASMFRKYMDWMSTCVLVILNGDD
jgi:hypothetical protein